MRKFVLTLLVISVLFVMVFAVPAMPGFRPFKQPDGSTIILELKGDEHFHFAQTEDGYSVIRDAEGWWTYAQKVDGLLIPSIFIVGKDNPPFAKFLRPDVEAVAALPQNALKPINWRKVMDIDFDSKDALSDSAVLVVLGAFDDSAFLGVEIPATRWDTAKWDVKAGYTTGAVPGGTAHDSVYWDSVFFSDSPGSYKTYYLEITYGKWECWGDVIGPLSSGGCYGDYGDGAELTFMQDVADASSGRMELTGNRYSNYDGDGDGYVDHWVCVRAGGEQSATGSTADMWATKYTTTISTTTGATILNPTNAGEITDAYMNDYTDAQLQDTLFVRSRTMGIGIHCHESWHAFGAEDLYDYGYQGTPAGDWALMAAGSWTDDGVQPGSRPAHPGAMQQYSIEGDPEDDYPTTFGFFEDGWLQRINTNGRYMVVGSGLPINYGGPRLYMIQNSTFQTADEYFMVSNRCDYGVFEGNLPEHGILIVHYDPSEKGLYYNDGPTVSDYYTYWIEQRGFDPKTHYDNTADTIYRDVMQAAYFAGDDYEFTNLTFASAHQNGLSTEFGPYIISISAPGDTMWFTVANANAASTASFAYKTETIYDTITGYGNGDNIANPDEMFDLVIDITNVGANASSVTAILRNTDGKAEVVDSQGTYGTVNLDAIVGNDSDPFRVKFNPGLPVNSLVSFDLIVNSSAGSTTVQLALRVNSTNVVRTFKLVDVNSGMADPTGLDVLWSDYFSDWIMFSNGTGFSGGSNTMYWFDLSTLGSVYFDYMATVGATYIYSIDHTSDDHPWYANGDSVYEWDLSTGAITRVRAFKWHNTDYAASDPERARGLTFDNDDSLYVYWQTYASLIESVFGETKVADNGIASKFWGMPLTDGEGYGGYWNNGRGLEFDGNCFWSVCIWKNKLYRRDKENFLSFFEMPGPSVYGSYPMYDIAWQACGPTGDDQVVPYGWGNKYYIWTVNMENSEVFQINVTDVVLPQAVDLDVSACVVDDVNDRADLVWHPNKETDYVDHYIIYRSSDPNFYASSDDSIGTTTDTTFTDYPPVTKATYYYKVKAVNYYGYSQNASYDLLQADFTTGTQEVSLSAMQISTDVILKWIPTDNLSGVKWNIYRKPINQADYDLIGSVNIEKGVMLNEYKYTDNTISENGIYNYKLVLVRNNGAKTAFKDIKFKYFNNFVFGIAPLNQNPVRGNEIVLSYGIDREANVSLKLYSITGSVVSTPVAKTMRPGKYTARINTHNLPAGTYFAILKQDDKESKQKIMLIK